MSARHRSLTKFGLAVRREREARSLTQERLAERANLDSTYISGIERGVRNASLISLVRVAKGLGLPLAKLCEGVDA
ncbi:MAG: helix-turn-helix domain-containing protein [Chthoniobacterales bacterium]